MGVASHDQLVTSEQVCHSYQVGGGGQPKQGSVFFTRVFALVLEWDHWHGIRLLRYLNDWLMIVESVPLLLQHQEQLLQLCWGLGIVIIGGKLDLKPSSKAQYLGMLIDTIGERVFPMDSLTVRFRDLAGKFLLLPSPLIKMWQQLWAT